MSKIKKIFSSIFLIIIALFYLTTNVQAALPTQSTITSDGGGQSAPEETGTTASDIITGADDFIQSGVSDENPTINDSDLKNMSDLLYNILLIIAIIVAVIVGLVIAIQFITGSVAQKAKVKETLIPYIAGCIVIFGAFGIWKLVVGILNQTQ